MSGPKKRVSYYYDEEIGNYYYSYMHPMKPHRIRLTDSLIVSYDLFKRMEIFRPTLATEEEMTQFHADDYIHFLQNVTPDNVAQYSRELQRYNVDMDCPVFDGLYRFCQIYTGGSINGAYKLNHGQSDIAINWAGGLHHAKKSEASGFCYVNDIVLAILELLKFHARVLYIDIDIHHGDGVEEAFYSTDRVMTVSFHKHGEYFPGTGDVNDIGVSKGKNYSINFPLNDGIDDEAYESIFKPIIGKIMETYQPSAIVLQCGADSLTGDRLGCFNLTLKGHGMCVEYVKSFNVPLLLLGGGGYSVRNVARCWVHETAIALGQTLDDDIPENDYYEYFGPNFKLHLTQSNMENLNPHESLEKIKIKLFEVLRDLPCVPSVPFHTVPREIEKSEPEADPDVRFSQSEIDRIIYDEKDFYESERDNVSLTKISKSISISASVNPMSNDMEI